jgi:hypothetical protein
MWIVGVARSPDVHRVRADTMDRWTDPLLEADRVRANTGGSAGVVRSPNASRVGANTMDRRGGRRGAERARVDRRVARSRWRSRLRGAVQISSARFVTSGGIDGHEAEAPSRSRPANSGPPCALARTLVTRWTAGRADHGEAARRVDPESRFLATAPEPSVGSLAPAYGSHIEWQQRSTVFENGSIEASCHRLRSPVQIMKVARGTAESSGGDSRPGVT